MKAKNFLMTILLVMGFVGAKAQVYPPELVLVSQPVMTYNDYSITVYYDLQNIGDVRYKGNIYIYLSPDDGCYYAKEYVKIRPGRIKRVAIEIPAYRPNPSTNYMVMPYYSLDDELYSFTTFEYFEPLTFHWYGPRTEVFYVTVLPPCPLYYTRPYESRFFYDGYRPMHPYRPEDPLHHTYHWHYNNGGYPGAHPGNPGVPPKPNGGNVSNSNAVVRPPVGGNTPGSMSVPAGNGSNSGASVNNGSNAGSLSRPAGNNSNSGATTRPSSGNANAGSGSVSRPSSGSNSSVTRPSSAGTTRQSGNTNNNSGTVSRPSSGNRSSSARPSSSSSSNSSNSRSSSSGKASRSSSRGGDAGASRSGR